MMSRVGPDWRISPNVIVCWRGMRPILPTIESSLNEIIGRSDVRLKVSMC